MYFMTSITTVLEHLMLRVPYLPQGDATKARTARMFLRPLLLFLAFTCWVVIGGGFVIPYMVEADWTAFEGMYFSYITATTIGLGDYTYDIEESKGIVMIWVLVSLALLHALVMNVNRLINVVMLSYSVNRDASKTLAKIDDDELIVVATTFMVADLDGNHTIDCKELRYMLSLVGLHVDAVLEHKIDELMYLHDKDGSNSIEMQEWYLIAAGLMTKYGQKCELLIQLRDFILALLLVVISLFLGGYVMHKLEFDYEQDHAKKWEALLSAHYDSLNTTEQMGLSDLVDYLTKKGGCSLPACKQYETGYHGSSDQSSQNMFHCQEYVSNWDLTSSIFFMFTLFTTVGYGSFTPQTSMGKLFTCVYSCFGIILTSYFIFAILDVRQVISRLVFPSEQAGLSVNMGGGGRYGGGRKNRVLINDGGASDDIVSMLKESGVGSEANQDDGFNKQHGVLNSGELSNQQNRTVLERAKHKTSKLIGGMKRKLSNTDRGSKTEEEKKLEKKKNRHVTFIGIPPLPKELKIDHMILSVGNGNGNDNGGDINQQQQQPLLDNEGCPILDDNGLPIYLHKQKQRRRNIAHVKHLDKPDTALGLVGASDLVSSAPELPKSFDPYVFQIFMRCFLYAILFAFIIQLYLEDDWSLLNSLYFMWISCTGIGLGDFSPGDEHEIEMMFILLFGLSCFIGMFVFMEGTISSLFRSHISIPPSVRFSNAINEVKHENPEVLKRANEEIRKKRQQEKELHEQRLKNIEPQMFALLNRNSFEQQQEHESGSDQLKSNDSSMIKAYDEGGSKNFSTSNNIGEEEQEGSKEGAQTQKKEIEMSETLTRFKTLKLKSQESLREIEMKQTKEEDKQERESSQAIIHNADLGNDSRGSRI